MDVIEVKSLLELRPNTCKKVLIGVLSNEDPLTLKLGDGEQ